MKVKINKKTYEVQELQIGAYTHIEEQGFSIVDAIQKRQHMLLAVALVCGVVGYDRAEAEHIVEQHILGGGTIVELSNAFMELVYESDFFRKMLGMPTKAEEEEAEKKAKADQKKTAKTESES